VADDALSAPTRPTSPKTPHIHNQHIRLFIKAPLGYCKKKSTQEKETHVEVEAETASIVIRRRHGPAMTSPHALPEAPSPALPRALFSLQ